MYGVKHFLKIIFPVIIFQSFTAQNDNQNYYLIFDSSSNKLFEYEVGNGEVEKDKVYRKEYKKNGDRFFYIKNELFRNVGNANTIDTCNLKSWPKNNISNIADLKRKVDTTNALYPYKVFPKLFLIEKLNDSMYVKYKVKWEYYIE